MLKLPVDSIREVYALYKRDPYDFANTFFDILDEMDPKSVRVVCAELWLQGISMQDVFDYYTGDLGFLERLDQIPPESIIMLLKYQFPEVVDGDLFIVPSLDRPLDNGWLDLVLDYIDQIDHVNWSSGETCLHYAVRNSNLALATKLLAHHANPNALYDKGETPMEMLLGHFADTPEQLYMVRLLRRYGARVDGQVSDKIRRELYSADKIEPYYADRGEEYYSLDKTTYPTSASSKRGEAPACK